ncbi:hypothetical protein J3L16_15855, partial [Alteromonas sp. 5E99-2]|uniref:hypothetical protein n=1 Tax=Alteromonas sp. 5E99-2 TaxID=2817683 RepID=UPI001A984206
MNDKKYNLAKRFASLPKEKQKDFLLALENKSIDFTRLPIVKSTAEHVDNIPLSYAQTGLWLTWQLNPESAAYNMSGV